MKPKKHGIQIENYQEETQENEEKIKENQEYSPIIAENKTNTNGLKLEILPIKGDTKISNGDTLYEGEYIKYNIKATNISDQTIKNIKIVGKIPEGTTYAELDADYENDSGEYKYNYEKEIKEKTIEIETLESGETTTQFYEVKVDNLPKEQSKKDINSKIEAFIGEEKIANYELNNSIEPAEVQVFLGSFMYGGKDRWLYEFTATSETKKTVNIQVKLPKIFTPESYYIDSRGENIITKYDENEIPKDNIYNLEVETGKSYILAGNLDATKLEQQVQDNKIWLTSTAKVTENNKTYNANENRILFEFETLEIYMTSSNEGEEVKYGEEIEYNITLMEKGKSNGIEKQSISVNLIDFLPKDIEPISVTYENWKEETEMVEGVEVATGKFYKLEPVTEDIHTSYEFADGEKLPNVDLYLTIPYDETIQVKIKAKAGFVYQKTKVENTVRAESYSVKSKNSNTVTHTILPYNYDELQEEIEKPDDIVNPGEENNDTNDPNNPTDKNETYSIAGIVWLDENEDGRRQENETTLEGITVMLVDRKDASVIKESIKTTAKGTYSFSNLNQGDYVVLFQYDTNKYHITEYQQKGVPSNQNSDAIEKETNINEKTLKVGMIEISNLKNSVSNQDIGFIQNKKCDFKLEKSISKVIVTTKNGTKQYNYQNQKLVKTEIKAKEIEGATVTIEYKIKVTNNGEVAGTVEKIIDYLPNELNISAESNKNWKANKRRATNKHQSF